jgi:hypothetical protein
MFGDSVSVPLASGLELVKKLKAQFHFYTMGNTDSSSIEIGQGGTKTLSGSFTAGNEVDLKDMKFLVIACSIGPDGLSTQRDGFRRSRY